MEQMQIKLPTDLDRIDRFYKRHVQYFKLAK